MRLENTTYKDDIIRQLDEQIKQLTTENEALKRENDMLQKSYDQMKEIHDTALEDYKTSILALREKREELNDLIKDAVRVKAHYSGDFNALLKRMRADLER